MRKTWKKITVCVPGMAANEKKVTECQRARGERQRERKIDRVKRRRRRRGKKQQHRNNNLMCNEK